MQTVLCPIVFAVRPAAIFPRHREQIVDMLPAVGDRNEQFHSFFFEYLRKADEQYFLSAALGDGVTADTDSCITYMRTLWALVFHFSHHHIMA